MSVEHIMLNYEHDSGPHGYRSESRHPRKVWVDSPIGRLFAGGSTVRVVIHRSTGAVTTYSRLEGDQEGRPTMNSETDNQATPTEEIDGAITVEADVLDGYLTVNLTQEGTIIDVFSLDGGHLGTFARTYDEWAEDIVPDRDPSTVMHDPDDPECAQRRAS